MSANVVASASLSGYISIGLADVVKLYVDEDLGCCELLRVENRDLFGERVLLVVAQWDVVSYFVERHGCCAMASLWISRMMFRGLVSVGV